MRARRALIGLLVAASLTSACAVREPQVGVSAAQPLGVFCGEQCRAALASETPPEQVSCQVAFLNPATSFPYGAAQALAAQRVATAYPGMRFSVLNAEGSVTTQTSQLDTVVNAGADVVILDAVVADALAPAARRAMERGAKVIAVDRSVNAPVLSTIKAPDVELGDRIAEHAAEQLGGRGRVAILSGTPGASPTIDRTTGITRTLARYPGIEIVDDVNGNYDITQGYQATRNLLAKYGSGELDWIISHGDVMSLGAIQAIKAAHREGTVRISGIDGQQQGLERVADGSYEATVVYPVAVSAGVVAAAKTCAGEPLPERIPLDYPLVTRAEVDQYLSTTYG